MRNRFCGSVSVFALLAALGSSSGCRPIDRCCDPLDFEDSSAAHDITNGPGIALSFDDAYVEAWYATAELLEAHGARATFFVTRMDRLSDEQVALLHDLEDRGHEIGCHGHRHLPAGKTERDSGTQAWVDEELLPSLQAFADAGFAPRSFSFPYGEHTDGTGEAALEHFDHIRGSRFIGPLPAVKTVDAVFLPASELPRRPFSCSFAIDERYGITEGRLTGAMDRAAEQDEVLAMYGHEPLDGDTRGLQTSHQLLEHVLEGAAERSLRFYLYREFSDAE